MHFEQRCHKVRDSLLSSSSFKNLNNYGISNVCFAILVVSNLCLALENVEKYGILINPVLWVKIYFIKLTEISPALILSGLNIFSLFSLGLEILLSKGIVDDKQGLILATISLTFEILIPLFVIRFIDTFAIAFTIVVCYIAVFLKLISYHMVNYWCRQNVAPKASVELLSSTDQYKDVKREDKDEDLIQYPNNLCVKDIFYFLYAPTLCYELNFPLLPKIRKRFLFCRILEVIFLLPLIIILMQQLIVPVVIDYQDILQDMKYIKVLEIFLKITIPFYAVWMLCFYFFFHSWLNVVGEVLRFGDRLFYKDWWNAESVAIWWRKWNIPVHKWCLRHLYIPMLQCGYTKLQAISVVFFVSGVLHEYFFSIPLNILKAFMFIGIFFGQQIYFAFASDQPPKHGNMCICISSIISQPLLLLCYYYCFYMEHSANVKTQS